jgi:dihydrofolate synthase/folylpolyglutamate synthase
MLDQETQDYLYTLRRRGIKIGLHRTEALLSRCGNPHKNVPVIHIAGTNGKGSTAAMIASILRESGRKVGLYTSPHLVRFNERIRVNGIPISDENIIEFMNRYKKDIDALSSTFFETTTALTLSHFATEEVDVAVVEVGLGGRLDSTNVANTVISVITPIDYDHMEFLGYDLASITREKCGILKKDVPALTSIQQNEVTQIIHKVGKEKGISIINARNIAPIDNISLTTNGSYFTVDGNKFFLPLLGKHQIINAQTTLATCKTYDHSIRIESLCTGLKNVSWPGRLQKLSNKPLVYYDVAHNPHALKAVFNTLKELYNGKDVGCIFAIKKSKDIELITDLVKKNCTKAIITKPENNGFFDPYHLKLKFRKSRIDTMVTENVQEAIKHCIKPDSNCDLWLIFGTHYIADTIFKIFHFPFDKGEI